MVVLISNAGAGRGVNVGGERGLADGRYETSSISLSNYKLLFQ